MRVIGWNEWNNEQMEAAEGINWELEGHLVSMRPFSLTTQALKKQVVYTALEWYVSYLINA